MSWRITENHVHTIFKMLCKHQLVNLPTSLLQSCHGCWWHGPCFNIKTVFLGLGISMKSKMFLRLSYLYYRAPYTCKTSSLCRGSPPRLHQECGMLHDQHGKDKKNQQLKSMKHYVYITKNIMFLREFQLLISVHFPFRLCRTSQ